MKQRFFGKRIGSAITLVLGTTLAGCNIDMNISDFEGVPLSEFDLGGEPPTALVLAGPDEVIITEGSELTITVEGDSEAAAAVLFDRDDDTLEIGRDTDLFDGKDSAIIRVTMPAPRELGIAGSGVIEAATLASEAEIDIAGSGNVAVTEVTADRLDVNIAGSGNVTTAGTVKELDIDIAGSGNANLANLKADEADISIAGSGDIEIASDGTVDASIAGSGDIEVIGSATCSLDAAGSGTITCKPAATADASSETDGGDDATEE